VTLIHRRNEFRGALDSVDKVQELKNNGKINIITPAEVTALIGEDQLEAIEVTKTGEPPVRIQADNFIPLFGLSPKLGPIADWGLEIEKNAIKVNNALDYQTNIPGVFAIGDVNTYPGKLKLILCGFHEATLMCQAAYQIINPGKRYVLKYTTVSGIDGFDGTRKEAPKAVVKSIN
jgi:thioredoxin reductase (NADPH)